MKIPMRIKWTFHNLVGHPFSGLFSLFGFDVIGDYIHDVTCPEVLVKCSVTVTETDKSSVRLIDSVEEMLVAYGKPVIGVEELMELAASKKSVTVERITTPIQETYDMVKPNVE